MSNSIFNSKLTVMVAAVASVLLAGIGMNSAAYAVLRDGEFFGISIDDIGQSAECVGVLVECRDNSHNIKVKDGVRNGDGDGDGNGDGGPQTCEECFDVLTEAQMDKLLLALNLENETELCFAIETGSLSGQLLYRTLVNVVGLSLDEALDIVECLDLELPN